MRKTKVFLIILMLTIIFSINSYASENNVTLVGNNEIEAENTQTIKVKISNNEPVGVIEGVLKTDSNIEIISFKSIKSDWTLTYNKSNGKFNSFNAKGTENDEILQIEYKLKNGANSRNYCNKQYRINNNFL